MPHARARPAGRRPALLTVGAVLGYVVAFYLLSPVVGGTVTFLSTVPVVTIAWCFGLRAGLGAAALALVVNVLLKQSVGPFAWREVFAQGIPGTISLLCIGGVIGWSRELHWRVRAEVAERQRAEAHLRAIVDGAAVGVALVDGEGRIIESNPALARLLGYTVEELCGRTIASITHPEDVALNLHLHGEMVAGRREHYQIEKRYLRRDGSLLWGRLTVSPVRRGEGTPPFVVGMIEDITERKAAEARLSHRAYHDPLTDLPNRLLFGERVAGALAAAERRRGALALLFLDLDRFKVINDSLGHDVGDQLLVAVAARLLACVRPGDTVARLGGDEFTILLAGVGGEEDVTRVATRITGELGRPFPVNGHEIVVTASIGIVIADPAEGGDSAADLLRYADMAMYQAKGAGKARHAIFDRSLGEAALSRLALEADLRHAIERGELAVAYQPQLDLATGRIAGAEALVRWRHPERGLIPPGDFIPLAEETGLILPLGRWVLREGCREARRWQDESADDSAPTVSVNLSVRQFQDPELVPTIAAILAETGLPARSLTLEITESTVMEVAPAADTLDDLVRLGVRLAIDDFGTGYSSLSYLKRFPVEALKIDKAFVAGLGRDPEDEAIVAAVVALGHGLGLRVCAEGVETAAQAALLGRLGCDTGQGYHFAPPLPATAFADALDGERGAASADQGREIALAGAV